MRNLLKFIATALLLSPWMLSATTTPVTTRVGSGSVCPGNDIIVPVTVQHCEQVGSISLVLSFDNTKVSYMGCQDFNDQFSSMILNQVDGNIYFAWAETNSVSLEDNDTIVSLRFNGIVGSTSLAWQTAQCEYTDTIGNVIPSNYVNGSINVYQSPTINSGPIDRTIVEGQSTTFEVNASGYGLSYQWRVLAMDATEWVDLSNGGHYSNVNNWRLNVNNVDLDMSGNHYCCVVSGTCEPQVESDMAQLLVTPTPHETINTTAQSTSSCPYVNFAIPITVTNCDNVGAISLALHFDSNRMSYEGYQNPNSALGNGFEVNALNSVVYFTWSSSTAINIGNATLIELLFASESGNSYFQWVTDDCEYSDGMGNLISTSFSNGSVTVYYAPSVTSHPTDRLVDQGANTNFSIGASGQGLSYQWQVSTDGGYNWSNLSNGGHYSNVNYYRLDVNNVLYDMTGYRYRCMVSGTCEPSAFSNSAVLTVRPTTIHTSVASASACPDTEFGVAVSVTNFNNVGAISLALNYNPDILTYTGYSNVNEALSAGDLVVNATGGTIYVSWSSANGATIGNGTLFSFLFTGVTGSSSLQWNTSFCEYTTVLGDNIPMTFSNGNANIYQVAVVTGHPEDRCIYETQNTTFNASGSGQGLSYQWQVNTNDGSLWTDLANGEHYGYVTSSTLRVNNVTMSMNGYRYRCRITGSCGDPVFTEAAELTVIVSQPIVIAENATWQCTGEVSQNIMVEHFNNVGSFSLVLDYDTNYLRYLEHFDLNSAMSTGDFVINYTMGKIYMTYSSVNPLNIGNGKLFCLKFDSSGGNATNHWQINSCEVTDAVGNLFNTSYVNGYINVFSNCEAFTDIDIDYFWYDEIMDLCSRGIVSGYQCQVMPNQNLKRAQLAKMLFISLFGSANASVVTDGFPSPFLDMQKTNTYYYKYAKAMSYLEYRDGISVFDRDKMNFNPEGTIKREYFIKALLETFNIPPLYQDTVIFADVPLDRPTRGYINRAYKMGILVDVNPDQNTKYFHPETPIKRGDAMGYLDWLISLYSIPQPNNSQDITQSDFFIPGNYTPYNFTSILGQEIGNFNHTTKSSFNIPARGFPLQFEHTYNSFLTELPNQIFATDPLGQGWSHNYNAYIINTDEVLDDYGHPLATPCLIIFWPDGTIHVYDNENAPVHPKPITKGVYDVVTHTYSDQYTVKMKDQSIYTFTKIAGAADDSPYMLTRMEDRHGNATVLTYGIGQNGLPRLSTVSDNAGRDLVFTYHPNTNYLKKVVDPLSRSVSFVIEDDNLTAYVNAKGDSTFYYYDTLTHYSHLLDSIKLPKGNVITNTYEQRKLTSTKYNNGSPTTIQHNPNYVANANVFYSSTVTESMGGSTVNSNYQYDRNGNQTHFNIGNTSDVTKTFDKPSDPNLLTSITNNKTGMVIRYEYDSVGNTTKIIREGGGMNDTIKYVYNGQNDLIRQVDAKGNATEYTYSNGKLMKVTNALNQESQFTYNAYGQPVTMTDAVGNQVVYGYDSYGNTNSVTISSMNQTASMTYDLASRMIQATDFNGFTKSYIYDVLDALLKETDALGYETGYVYDKNGNLTAICNAAGDSTLFTYDFDSDMLLSMSFQGISKYFTYNEDGSLNTLTTTNGDVFNYSYDNQGRLTDDGYATYVYNATGNLQSVTRNGKSISYGYDIFNRITSQSYDGQTVSYNYDCNDNMIQMTYPGNHVVQYDYDALNKLNTVTDWNGNVTSYNYRPDGTLSSSLYPNQVLNEYTYDGAGRITDMGSKRGNGQGTDIVHYHYEMDNNGNHLSSLALEQFVDMPIVDWSDVSYSYNAFNRLLSDGVNEYQYDYNGNMTAKGGATYNYDVLNNLVSYGHNGNYAYTYDGLGKRRSASRNGELTKFVLDPSGNVLAELDGSNAVQCYYVYGHGVISRIKPDNSTNYYIYDYRGSVVAMTDDTEEANVTHKYQYDDFGNIIQTEEADFNPYRYLGKYGATYEDSCLYFMHARYYDPTIGRFLSEDPVWSTNLYAYAANNPITMIDESGNTSKIVQFVKDEYQLQKNFKWKNYEWKYFFDDLRITLIENVEALQVLMEDEITKENPNMFKYYSNALIMGVSDIWIVDEYREALIWCAETTFDLPGALVKFGYKGLRGLVHSLDKLWGQGLDGMALIFNLRKAERYTKAGLDIVDTVEGTIHAKNVWTKTINNLKSR